MEDSPKRCPRDECPSNGGQSPDAFRCRKRGNYTHRATGETSQRWECLCCGRTFTRHNEAGDRWQRKSDINRTLFDLLCSGMTMRRAAKVLGVSRHTVERRAAWLSRKARAAHLAALDDPEPHGLLTSHIQFDEMVSHIHTRAKQLTIAIAVRVKNRKILSAVVRPVRTTGRLAEIGRDKYRWLAAEGPRARAECLAEAARCAKTGKVRVSCDSHPSYPSLIKAAMPHAEIRAYSTRKRTSRYDPLFAINHVCASIRADVACMARRSWTTTKVVAKLQERLWLYMAWNNGYEIIKTKI